MAEEKLELDAEKVRKWISDIHGASFVACEKITKYMVEMPRVLKNGDARDMLEVIGYLTETFGHLKWIYEYTMKILDQEFP